MVGPVCSALPTAVAGPASGRSTPVRDDGRPKIPPLPKKWSCSPRHKLGRPSCNFIQLVLHAMMHGVEELQAYDASPDCQSSTPTTRAMAKRHDNFVSSACMMLVMIISNMAAEMVALLHTARSVPTPSSTWRHIAMH